MKFNEHNTTGFYPLTAMCLVPLRTDEHGRAYHELPEQVTSAVGIGCTGRTWYSYVRNYQPITLVCEDRGDYMVACNYGSVH